MVRNENLVNLPGFAGNGIEDVDQQHLRDRMRNLRKDTEYLTTRQFIQHWNVSQCI